MKADKKFRSKWIQLLKPWDSKWKRDFPDELKRSFFNLDDYEADDPFGNFDFYQGYKPIIYN